MPLEFSQVLENLFPAPSDFPGGAGWENTCQSVYGENWSFSGNDCETQQDHYSSNDSAVECSDPLCDVSGAFGFVQVILMFAFYGFILFKGSVLISEGSELLLLVPSWRGLVGTLVLPILGAVPDGAIVLFSGLGKNARSQIQVGVGALAGSTIMLLTIPWCLSIFGGSVPIRDGKADYKHKRNPEPNCFKKGISVKKVVKINAMIMLVTAAPYFLVQIPAFIVGGHGMTSADDVDSTYSEQAKVEKYFALAGCIISTLLFIAYLVYCFFDSRKADAVQEKAFDLMAKKLARGEIDLVELFKPGLSGAQPPIDRSESARLDYAKLQDEQHATDIHSEHLRRILKRYFDHYDTDASHTIDRKEFVCMMRALGMDATEEWDIMDADNNNSIEFDEFHARMVKLIATAKSLKAIGRAESKVSTMDDGEESEEEEVDEAFFDEVDGKRTLNMGRVKRKAFLMMGIGTFMVLLFSDPMCGVLNEFGDRLHIPPFFIAFIFAPLASNASEVIASYGYSTKKTKETITVSFTALEGAAIMNNTFCTAIFFILIFAQDLAWTFAAETIAIIFVELVMFGFGMIETHTRVHAVLVLLLYPISLALVAGLEKAGLD